MANIAKYHVYTPKQVTRYLVHISMVDQLDSSPTEYSESTIAYLTELQRNHLASVPFANIALHYSTSRTISLDPEELYESIVIKRRGGYCMEVNCLFGSMLRSLGFNVYSGGARVNIGDESHEKIAYMGWSHMVNFVTFSNGSKFMVDVGFGVDNPIQILPLDAGRILPNMVPQEMRLVHENIEGNLDAEQKLWIYQVRDTSRHDWKTMYCFSEQEFRMADYEMMNFYTSQSRKSMFTQKVLSVKKLQGHGGIYGQLILVGNEFKVKEGGVSEVLRKRMTEADRIEVLETSFGIVLNDAERRGIRGLVSELK